MPGATGQGREPSVIDECHRGGAKDESNWRGILEYFAPAVQLGLTATPKRKENVDTYAYFGDPVYIYSLKDGINDGFLTPFKVRQISTTLDEYVYTPDDTLVEGEIETGKRYTETDFNKIIEIKEREAHMMKTSFWHPDGTPMSARQFMELLFGKLPEFFKNEDELRAIWSAPDTREKLLQGLAEKGFGAEQLAEMRKIIDAEKSDIFDVLAHVAYALPPLTPLLRLKYHDSIADAVTDLGRPEEIGRLFSSFQKYLYQQATVA